VHSAAGIDAEGRDRVANLLLEIKDWQQRWREECRLREKVSADFLVAQKDWERFSEETRMKHEQECGNLRQQVRSGGGL